MFPAGSGKTGTVALKNGLSFDVDLGDLFGAEFFVGNMNETDVLNALTATLPENANTVDVGANFGLFGAHAGHVAQYGKVVALEPLPSAFQLLEKNIEQNGLSSNIQAVNAAVSKRGGKAKFFVATDGAFSGLRDTGRSPLLDTVTVSKTALDKCDPVNALEQIDFLKIDTEGHEADVLAGASQTLARSTSALIMLEYSHKNLTEDARSQFLVQLDQLLGSGFEGWLYAGERELLKLEKASDISPDASGTVFLSGRECVWSDDFFKALKKEADEARPTESDESAILILSEFAKVRSQVADLELLHVDFPPEDSGAALSKRVLREVSRLRVDLDRNESHRNALQKNFDSADAERTRLKKRAAELQEAVDGYKAFASNLQEKMDKKVEVFSNRVEKAEAGIAEQRARAEGLKEALEKSEHQRRETTEKLAAAEARKNAFQKLADSLQVKLNDRQAKSDRAIAAATAQAESFKVDLDQANRLIEASNQELAKAKVSLADEKAAHEKTHRDLKFLLSEERGAHKETRVGLETKLADEKAAHEKTHRDLKALLSQERSAHKETREHLDVSRQLRVDQRLELEEAAAEQAVLKSVIAALSEDNQGLQAEINEQRSMIRSLQQLDSLHELGLGKHLRDRKHR